MAREAHCRRITRATVPGLLRALVSIVSIDLGPRRLDDLRPFVGLGANVGRGLLRGSARGERALREQELLPGRALQPLIELGVQLGDDRWRRAGRREDPEPRRGFESR